MSSDNTNLPRTDDESSHVYPSSAQQDNWPSLRPEDAQLYSYPANHPNGLPFSDMPDHLSYGPMLSNDAMLQSAYPQQQFEDQSMSLPFPEEHFHGFHSTPSASMQQSNSSIPSHPDYQHIRPSPPQLVMPNSTPAGPTSAPAYLPSHSESIFQPTALSHSPPSSASARPRSSVMHAIEDPQAYSLENGLPPMPQGGRCLTHAPPTRTTTVMASSINPNPSSAPNALDPRLSRYKAMQPLGSQGWTPAKLYQTPIRRMQPGVAPHGWKSKSDSPPSTATRDSTPRAGLGRSPRDMDDRQDDEGDESGSRTIVDGRSRKRRSARSDAGRATTRPTKKRTADLAYVRALEQNIEHLKQQILHLGQQPFGLEGVNDTAAMSLDSAKLVIQAQQMDLDTVRGQNEDAKHEISQLRSAMNSTHALFPPPNSVPHHVYKPTSTYANMSPAEIEACRRGSIESVASTSSVTSMSSISSTDSMGSMTSGVTSSTVPSPGAAGFGQTPISHGSATAQQWPGGWGQGAPAGQGPK